MRSLSEMFNVNYFLVSQTNPHIVPALNLKKRVNRKLGNLLEAEWKHRCAHAWHFLFIRSPAWKPRSAHPGSPCLEASQAPPPRCTFGQQAVGGHSQAEEELLIFGRSPSLACGCA